MQHSTGDIPDLKSLPAPIRSLYEASFGDAVGHLFMVAAPFAVVAFVCILFIKEVPLRTSNGPSVAESEIQAGVLATSEAVDYPAYDVEGDSAQVGNRR
ncbi:hypothetical protein [Nocardioides convexus]|uniref:hypothetical protein n=1 Tax=Nocardioides convexus TaxID=2712224 RepID=UPI002418847F|nr:hypothetical protein [Nocardioides convexus]